MEMEANVVYTADQYQEMKEIEYFYQFVENRTLSPVLHRHEFYEICMMLKGWSVQEVNGERLEMRDGEIVFLCLTPILPKNVVALFYR